MRAINEFWLSLGICVEDLVYANELRSFDIYGDVVEFVTYGKKPMSTSRHRR